MTPIPLDLFRKVDATIKRLMKRTSYDDREDCYQQCWLAAVAAYRRWDSSRGVAAWSYMWPSIHGAWVDYFRKIDRPSKSVNSRKGKVVYVFPDEGICFPQVERQVAAQQAIDQLSIKEQHLLSLWARKEICAYAKVIGRDKGNVSKSATSALKKAKQIANHCSVSFSRKKDHKLLKTESALVDY